MVPKFKYYFLPFLTNLHKKGECRLYDLSRLVAQDLNLSAADRQEMTKGGTVTKHSSRINYCAAYLRKMGLVENFSTGSYRLTKRGTEILTNCKSDLSLDDLRELPEFLNTQIGTSSNDIVYVKSHMRGGKYIKPYVCKKKNLNKRNPNIQEDILESFMGSKP